MRNIWLCLDCRPPGVLQSVVACGVGDVIYVCVAVPAALMRSAGSLLLMNRALAACPHCVLQEATFTAAAHFMVNQHLSAAVDAVTPALTNMHTAEPRSRSMHVGQCRQKRIEHGQPMLIYPEVNCPSELRHLQNTMSAAKARFIKRS